MKIIRISLLTAFLTVLIGNVLTAGAQTRNVDVRFKPGASSATFSNTVTGNGSVDFRIKARAGQTLSAKLTSANKSLYFLVLKDLKTGEAIADDARDTIEWSGSLPSDGTYVVRVFLFRNEARRNKTPVRFSLRVGVE